MLLIAHDPGKGVRGRSLVSDSAISFRFWIKAQPKAKAND
jgi:hypothetical protein